MHNYFHNYEFLDVLFADGLFIVNDSMHEKYLPNFFLLTGWYHA